VLLRGCMRAADFAVRIPADIGAQSSSSGSSSEATAKAAIDKLRETTETLEKKEEHLLRKIDGEVKQARTFNSAGKKREALMCIKRKKMYEKQLEQISASKMTLETQRLALENLNINRAALQAQKAGADAMKQMTSQMGGVEAVEDTMDSVEEQLADADEIGQAMARPVQLGDADDDELLAELEELEEFEQEGLDRKLTSVKGAAKNEESAYEEAELESWPSAPMPSAPTSMPSAAMTDEDRELAMLEASMAM